MTHAPMAKTLPPDVIAATGMDAVTHAVESYLSTWATFFSQPESLSAVKRIVLNLLKNHAKGDDLESFDA